VKRRTRVAVLFGGRSGEHDVSIQSARSILGALDPERYETVPVYLDPSGRWTTQDETAGALAGNHEHTAQPLADAGETPGPLVTIAPVPPPALAERMRNIDVVFPVIHGTNGEDGTLQGLLELAGLPYVGSGVLGSAVGMDKVTAKAVFRHHGLRIGNYLLVTRSSWRTHPEDARQRIERQLGYPCFVKPSNLGSSVGVSKVHDASELSGALELAARYDRRIIVEQYLPGREIECSVLGNDDPIASVVGEVIPGHEFYNYEAKYVDDSSRLLIPAPLTPEQSDEIRRTAITAYTAIDCAGLARVDFFLVDGTLYLNEINTIPGFTRISMYPKLWEASGVSYADLVDRLIALAIDRHAEKMENATTYATP